MSVLVADGEGPVFHLGAAKADRQKSTQLSRSREGLRTAVWGKKSCSECETE